MLMPILLGLIAIFTASYFYITRKYGYFKSRGVTEHPTLFPFGCIELYYNLVGKIPITRFVEPFYRQYRNHKMVGYFSFSEPTLVVNDLDLAKSILIGDADYFIDRRKIKMSDAGSNKIFKEMLISLEGNEWKQMRSMLSPVFSSGKLKNMAKFINKVGTDMNKYLEKSAAEGTEFDAKIMMSRFTLDSIASCGFGVEGNSFDDSKDNEFRNMAKTLGGPEVPKSQMFKFMIAFFMPELATLLGITFFYEPGINFFMNLVRQILEQRKNETVKRNDLIDTMLDAMKTYQDPNSGKVHAISNEKLERYLLANLVLLFLAGFDTSSTIMAVALYYLAKKPEIQDRIYNEVYDAIGEKDTIDYDTVMNLPYLDMVIYETLRIYSLSDTERLCVKDYKVPGTDFVVPKGMMVQVSGSGISMDDRYFPNPEEFQPENFTTEAKQERGPFVFMAFGQGPRNCIGSRFALLQIKIAMARLITQYQILPCSKTVDKLEPDPWSVSGDPVGGTWIKVEKRN